MTTDSQWTGPRAAIRLTRIVETVSAVHGTQLFPIDVATLAHEAAEIFGWTDPITQIQSADIKKFEGALFPDDEKRNWMLLYNNKLTSQGRIRFTQAHELGHYILHRTLRDEFQCSDAADMRNCSKDEKDIEAQADVFASYLLMPLEDFRRQTSTEMNLDLLAHCADRYGVSLTAAALQWLSSTDQKAVFVVSTDGFINWSWSSQAAAKAGAFFRTKHNVIPIPEGSLAANDSVKHERKGTSVPAQVWFPHAASGTVLREMKLSADQYGNILTMLCLPSIADVWPPYIRED